MWVWIVLAAFIYVMLGCFHIGFVDLRIDEDGVDILWTIFLWPVFWIVLALAHIFMIPIKFGKKLGDRFLPSIDDYLDKLFSKE